MRPLLILKFEILKSSNKIICQIPGVIFTKVYFCVPMSEIKINDEGEYLSDELIQLMELLKQSTLEPSFVMPTPKVSFYSTFTFSALLQIIKGLGPRNMFMNYNNGTYLVCMRHEKETWEISWTLLQPFLISQLTGQSAQKITRPPGRDIDLLKHCVSLYFKKYGVTPSFHVIARPAFMAAIDSTLASIQPIVSLPDAKARESIISNAATLAHVLDVLFLYDYILFKSDTAPWTDSLIICGPADFKKNAFQRVDFAQVSQTTKWRFQLNGAPGTVQFDTLEDGIQYSLNTFIPKPTKAHLRLRVFDPKRLLFDRELVYQISDKDAKNYAYELRSNEFIVSRDPNGFDADLVNIWITRVGKDTHNHGMSDVWHYTLTYRPDELVYKIQFVPDESETSVSNEPKLDGILFIAISINEAIEKFKDWIQTKFPKERNPPRLREVDHVVEREFNQKRNAREDARDRAEKRLSLL